MKGEFIKAFHKHRQEHYRGLSEGFLWHSTCQDNTIGRMWQVHVSAVMTRRTRFFGGTAVNRRLKNAVIGAATSAIRHRDNAFKDYYERMLSNGITPANAKHSVARKMVSTMSAMWKTDSKFDEKLF